jgi:5-methylcytosine-specific restriction protein A
MPTMDDFRREVIAQIARAQRQGRPHVEINAGELHRVVGDYPDAGAHRMPMACAALRELKTASDEIIFAPEGGNGASLTIRYKLPR